MKKNHALILTLLVFAMLLYVEPAYAGPGGVIAKGLFKTFWGKLLLSVLVIIFLPVILYVRLREWIEIRKNMKVLAKLAAGNKDLNWLNLQKQVKDAFQRVYKAWGEEDMEKVAGYVSTWYWRNQQLVHLDRWKENNLQNICHLKKVDSIKPLYLEITDQTNLEGSKIAFIITAEVEDYLIERGTSKVVEGAKGFGSEEKIWIMEYSNGAWILDDIQESDMSLAFAKLPNVIPAQASLV